MGVRIQKTKQIKESEERPDVRVTARGGFYLANPAEFLQSKKAQELIKEVEKIPVSVPPKEAGDES